MRRSLALLVSALLLTAACTESPTAATKRPAIRFDGGLYYGSGNAVGGGVNTTGSGNVSGDSGGGIFIGGGATMPADSATETDRGGNYFGSGN